MALFEFVFAIVLQIIDAAGYAGIFLLMAMESTVVPIPSESVMPFAGYLVASGKMDLIAVIVVSTLGSIAGSLMSYYIGMKGDEFVERHGRLVMLTKKDLRDAHAFFRKHGDKTIIIGRFLPVIRHLISIPAGFGRMDMKKFLLYTTIGAVLWNSLLAYAGFLLRQNWTLISTYSPYIDLVGLVILACAAAWFIQRHQLMTR